MLNFLYIAKHFANLATPLIAIKSKGRIVSNLFLTYILTLLFHCNILMHCDARDLLLMN